MFLCYNPHMGYVKRTLFILMTLAFVTSSIADVALASCICSDSKSGSEKSEMPCHQGLKSDASKANDGLNNQSEQQSKCSGCGCDHCKVPSQASLAYTPFAQEVVINKVTILLQTDLVISLIINGIDNPPKNIS